MGGFSCRSLARILSISGHQTPTALMLFDSLHHLGILTWIIIAIIYIYTYIEYIRIYTACFSVVSSKVKSTKHKPPKTCNMHKEACRPSVMLTICRLRRLVAWRLGAVACHFACFLVMDGTDSSNHWLYLIKPFHWILSVNESPAPKTHTIPILTQHSTVQLLHVQGDGCN